MKKKLLGLGLIGLSLLGLTSCGDDSAYTYKYTYNVKVVDIDGEVLLNRSFNTNEHSDVRNEIKDYTTVSGSDNLLTGFELKSIAGSVIDPNYELAIYENGVKTELGIDNLYVDNGDEFEFRVECWNSASTYGSLDENDILLDKAFYKYVKNEMPKVLKNGTSFDSDDYWTYMMISLMKRNKYSVALFNTNKVSQAVKTSINKQKVSSLSGKALGTYFYTARAMGLDLSSFKESYKTYLGTVTDYDLAVSPYDISPAYSLGYSEYVASSFKSPEAPSTDNGYDDYSLYVTSTALFNEYNSDSFNLPLTDQGSALKNANLLMAHSAINSEAKALADILVTNYYDSETGYIVNDLNDESGISFAYSNQLYAGIAAYKVKRDKKIAANIFE